MRKFLLLFTLCLLAAGTEITHANLEVIFTKIADTNTPQPGGPGNFTTFGLPSIDNNGNVAFYGDNGGIYGFQGIYISAGGMLSIVADENTGIPGDSELRNFMRFGGYTPSIDHGDVAFWGQHPATPVLAGIYKKVNGILTRVADCHTPIPGGPENFYVNGFRNPSIDSGNVAFYGSNSIFSTPTQEGIYSDAGGTLHPVVDLNTPIPSGSGNFINLETNLYRNRPSFEDGQISFWGEGDADQQGIYKNIDGILEKVVDINTLIPGGTGNFINFTQTISSSNEDIVFIGSGAEKYGVYAKINDLLCVIADNHTFVPYGQFTHFTKSSIDNEHVAFNCHINNYSAYLFTNLGGELIKVIGKSDTLDDKTVAGVSMGTEGLGSNKIAFRAHFSDGSAGIFVAEVMTCEVIHGGNNLWNIRHNGDDRFHSNEAWLRPWVYDYDNGWGRWVGGYTYEFQWYNGPYTQSSGSLGGFSWTIDSTGNLEIVGAKDNQWHVWTYVYVDTPKVLTITGTADAVLSYFLNYAFDNRIEGPANLNLISGWNRIDITGYNQNDSYSFNLNYALANNVDKMNSEPLPFGDLNHDCVVDVFDLEIFASNFGKTIDFDLRADTDCDGDVDGADLYILSKHLGDTCQ